MKLKPCPFCGGEAHLDREGIFCCDCGAQMPIPLYECGVGGCDGFPDYETARTEAIDRWEMRADHD